MRLHFYLKHLYRLNLEFENKEELKGKKKKKR
jgi:hypothetical protein